jgi:hypothetical protein
LHAQAQDPAQQPPATPPAPAPPAREYTPPGAEDRLSVGIRVRTIPFRDVSVMSNGQSMTTTAASGTLYDWNFHTTSRAPRFGGGLAAEVRINSRTMFVAELLYQRLSYDKVTDIYWGSDDPTTGHDERSRQNFSEHTEARYFDVPLLIKRQGIGSSGFLSRMLFSVGVTGRTVSRIRTTNTITFTDSTKSVNYTGAQPARRNTVGAVVGIGFRVIDDFRIKTTPEIRFTRWAGSTFGSDSTRSPRNQLEIGITFTR